jgi:membrane protein
VAKVLELLTGTGPMDPQSLFERFLPPHEREAGSDPFAAVETILAQITTVGQNLSLVAIPAFLWFSTRLFGSIRTALNAIYDVSVRPPRGGNFLVRYGLAKLRDLGMVAMTLTFFLANTLLTTGLSLLQAYARARGRGDGVFLTTLEAYAAQIFGFALLIVLFFLLYRYASLRKVRWPAALIAALFMAFAFEVAKRLYALYLRGATGYGTATLDATIGAMILFVVWLYYSALVFLLGGVVAETWELRTMQRAQRGIA